MSLNVMMDSGYKTKERRVPEKVLSSRAVLVLH
jgi:hypothetical protein